MSHNRADLRCSPVKGRSHFMLQMWCRLFVIHLILFHHTCLLLCCLICCLRPSRFCLVTNRLDHSQVCCHSPFGLLPLLLFVPGLAGATLVDWVRCFHNDGQFPRGQTGIFSNVDGEVGVERLQLLGKELIGQRVEAVRAPVESGPFQKVKSVKTNIMQRVCVGFRVKHVLQFLLEVIALREM